jgi:hypothetical protein
MSRHIVKDSLSIPNESRHILLAFGPVHLTYNSSYSACFFFQPEQYFSLTKNQSTVFFSRLIIPAERLLCRYVVFAIHLDVYDV